MSGSDHPVLVTGATGLVGRATLRQLKAKGRTAVAIDRIAAEIDGVEVFAAELADVHRLYALVQRQPLRGIIHCGAISGPMLGKDNPIAIVTTNIVGTANLLEIARIHAIPRFVFCSSCSVYGSPGDVPIGDDAPLRPTSVYGASKVAGEQLVAAYSREHGLDGVSLRLSWIYGPDRTIDCFLRNLVKAAIGESPFSLSWGAGFPRQYIHADDAAAALVTALDARSLPRTEYAVTGDRIDRLEDVAALVQAVFPRLVIALGDGPDPLDDLQGRIDVTGARRDLGFVPRIGLEEGIRDLAERLSHGPR